MISDAEEQGVLVFDVEKFKKQCDEALIGVRSPDDGSFWEALFDRYGVFTPSLLNKMDDIKNIQKFPIDMSVYREEEEVSLEVDDGGQATEFAQVSCSSEDPNAIELSEPKRVIRSPIGNPRDHIVHIQEVAEVVTVNESSLLKLWKTIRCEVIGFGSAAAALVLLTVLHAFL